jgi:acetolactate synthase I/II/III large subunit
MSHVNVAVDSRVVSEVESEGARELAATARVPLAADRLVRAMEEFGVRAAFGITGGAIGTIFDRLCQSELISVYHGQHEGGSAYAAMGRAIATRGLELPVCFATAGPGMTNLLTGVAAAYAESVPLLAITGNSSSASRHSGALQDSHPGGIDANRMFETITVANATARSGEELLRLFDYFARLSLRTRKPVHINVPLDVSNEPLPWNVAGLAGAREGRTMQPIVLNDPLLRPAKLSERERVLVDRFLTAQRPVIFAGNGIKLSGLQARLADAAKRHHIPVITTTHGRGAVAEDDPCFFGTFGFASDGAGREFLQSYEPDAIAFLGTGLGEMSTAGWSKLLAEPAFKLHVDIDRTKFNRGYQVEGTIENDVSVVLHDLEQRAPLNERFPVRPRTSMVVPGSRAATNGEGVHPRELFRELSELLPERSVVFADIGNSIAWAFRELGLGSQRQLFVPLGLSSMGSGLGAALGAATYWQDRPMVCVAGDCATLMQGSELKTAVENAVPLKVIVLNDGGHGMVHHGSRLIGLKNTHVLFQKRVDFEAYGRALGLHAENVRTAEQWREFDLRAFLDAPGPALLDVWIDRAVVPPIGDRAQVLGQSESQVAGARA